MKKRLLCLLCALALLPSGCASFLNREYSSYSDHVDYPVGETAAILQAENYQGLMNAILYFITEHEETGIIRLSNYPDDDVDRELDAACAEVCEEDPLAAYVVEDISHKYDQTASSYEVTISIQYAHTLEEVAAIVPAAGSTAIRQAVSAAMTTFSRTCVLRLSYFTGDHATLRQLIRQTWLDTPLAALVQPAVRVALYPDSGTSRIVEITLDWDTPQAELAEQSAALEQRSLALLEGLDVPPEALTPLELLSALRRAAAYDPAGAGSAYAALVDGSANDQGIALALRLLCQLADLEATVAEGWLGSVHRFWLITPTAEGYRHLDPTAQEPAYATDDAFTAAGYVWDAGRYPACTDYAAAGQPGDEPGAEDGENQNPEENGEGSGENGEDPGPGGETPAADPEAGGAAEGT